MSPDEEPEAPLDQADLDTLQAELRAAVQHRQAALERVREAHAEMEDLLARARSLLERGTGSDG